MNVYVERRIEDGPRRNVGLPIMFTEMNSLEDLLEHINALDEPVIVGRCKDGLKITPVHMINNECVEIDDYFENNI